MGGWEQCEWSPCISNFPANEIKFREALTHYASQTALLRDRPEELGLPLGLQLGPLRLHGGGALLQELGVRLGGEVVNDLAESGVK